MAMRRFETSRNSDEMKYIHTYKYIYIYIYIYIYETFVSLYTLGLILVEPWLVFAALVLTLVVGQAKTGKSRPSKLQHFIPHLFDHAKELCTLIVVSKC